MADNLSRKSDKRPIVCGTDFSPLARDAADIAAALAQHFKVRLILFHVEEFHGWAATDPTLFEMVASRNRQELDRESQRLRKSGATVDSRLLSGRVFDELLNAAAEANARLMVVGAIGHGVAQRLLIGSVAERVAEASPVPTLVVRPGARLLPWIRGKKTLKILVGYDFSPASDAALHWLSQIQVIGPTEIRIVHIDWPPEEARRFGYRGVFALSENPAQIQSFLERDVTERAAMLLPMDNVTITVEPGWGHPEGYLFEIAHREKVDLVVVGTHRRHGLGRLRFGSVSRTVLHHATSTVAVVPPLDLNRPPVMPKMDRILVATDFSDLGNKAIPYACAMLHPGGALKLIHVLEPDVARETRKGKPRPAKTNPKLFAKLRSLVPPEAEDLFEIDAGILENADAALAITQEAERFGANAICLGSHGRSGLSKMIMGSVAQRVVSQSRQPVLVVRASE